LAPTLIEQLRPFLTVNDITLLSHALTVLAVLLQKSPSNTFAIIEKQLLSTIYTVAHSPLVTGAALESVLAFIDALVQADGQIATHVIPGFVLSADKVPKEESSPGNVAKGIAQVVKSQQGVAAGTIAEYSKHIKV
jgi:cullin-associated NEDD8-dissociated protein 1